MKSQEVRALYSSVKYARRSGVENNEGAWRSVGGYHRPACLSVLVPSTTHHQSRVFIGRGRYGQYPITGRWKTCPPNSSIPHNRKWKTRPEQRGLSLTHTEGLSVWVYGKAPPNRQEKNIHTNPSRGWELETRKKLGREKEDWKKPFIMHRQKKEGRRRMQKYLSLTRDSQSDENRDGRCIFYWPARGRRGCAVTVFSAGRSISILDVDTR